MVAILFVDIFLKFIDDRMLLVIHIVQELQHRLLLFKKFVVDFQSQCSKKTHLFKMEMTSEVATNARRFRCKCTRL